MTDLFEKSIQILELPKVLERLAGQAVTQEGKERCLALRPMTDPDDVQRALDETSAAVDMSALRGSPSFSGVKPVAASLQRAHMGGALNTRELLDIAAVLRAARSAREYGEGDERKKTCIDHLFRSLTANRFLEDKITGSIVGEDEIADAASPELASIRRHIRATASKVRDILNKLLSSNQAKYLQEAIITQRNDRFVVPVKSEHKNDVPGLVHDVSSSGATFFIEPMGVVKANNELKELQAREEKEIERILAELSAECAQFKDDITQDYDLLILLDVIFARAKLAYRMRACAPRIVERGLYLRKARHPLLDPDRAVANDLMLGEDFDTLVITGPNTGGKTVTIKTIGLLTLMAQCGLHIPVSDDSRVKVFRRVLADVGDEQSIAQSLSTFSSHMVNIVGIIGEADDETLILFDELTGSPITDVRITLVAGRAHLKHTGGGDFRQATYRAVRQGLMEAESILLEPWYDFRLELPPEQVGRALSDLQRMGGQAGTPETAGALSVLTGSAPVAGLRDYGREVAAYTRGRGRLSCTAGGYAPCHNAGEVVAALGYDPERDVDNPADSVFCAHGAGYNVKWSEVKAHAHVDSGLRLGAEPPPPEEAAPVRPRSVSYAASLEQDKELQAIFERTYGKVERGAFRPQPKPARTSLDDRKYSIQAQKKGPEYLLADGYNLIFAWEELKAVARDNLDAARQMLMEVLSNYQGFKQNIVILVFDAYRVPRSVQDVTKYHNIYVVYTKEAETADTYIERATYEIGRHHRVRVATSDGAEQLIILGHGALRLSASAFKTEVEQVAGQISAILAANNRSAPSQPVAAALERARRRQEDKP